LVTWWTIRFINGCRLLKEVSKLNGYLDDRGEVIEITWKQYQYFLWNGFPKDVVIIKAPDGPHDN
jgi:hypothetical protein